MSRRPAATVDRSFGIVPVDLSDARGPRFLLVQHRAGHWGFPKGHAEGEESPREAALRELAEETGMERVRLLDAEPMVERYIFTGKRGQRVEKTVTYFVAVVDETDEARPQEAELLGLQWNDADVTRDLLSFDEGRRVLDAALALL